MVKLIFVTVSLMVGYVTAAVTAAPTQEFEALALPEEADTSEFQEIVESNEHLRFRRVTCTMWPFSTVPQNSACAAHCRRIHKTTSNCRLGVCQCSILNKNRMRFG